MTKTKARGLWDRFMSWLPWDWARWSTNRAEISAFRARGAANAMIAIDRRTFLLCRIALSRSHSRIDTHFVCAVVLLVLLLRLLIVQPLVLDHNVATHGVFGRGVQEGVQHSTSIGRRCVRPLATTRPWLTTSGSAGIAELLVFHPVDTTAKRLMSNVGKVRLQAVIQFPLSLTCDA